MLLEAFRGRELSRVLAEVRATLGEDALILRARTVRDGADSGVEVRATHADALAEFRRRIERPPLRVANPVDPAGGRPRVIALVGPTGSGKTTTLAKLALHADAFGDTAVGLLTLDTYRIGALEQLDTYARIARLPLETVYGRANVAGALRRLAGRDVVLVDTPGWTPAREHGSTDWVEALHELAPDEVHLVVPAGIRPDVALAMREALIGFGVTHSLIVKLDEVPDGIGVAELADALDLPARWVTTGREVPADLAPAGDRLVAALCGTGAPTRSVREAV